MGRRHFMIGLGVLLLMILNVNAQKRHQLADIITPQTIKDNEEASEISDNHKLEAHPYYPQLPYKSMPNNGPNNNTSKTNTQLDNLDSSWHFVFIALILGTLGGMKILSIMEQKMDQKQQRKGRKLLASQEEQEERTEEERR